MVSREELIELLKARGFVSLVYPTCSSRGLMAFAKDEGVVGSDVQLDRPGGTGLFVAPDKTISARDLVRLAEVNGVDITLWDKRLDTSPEFLLRWAKRGQLVDEDVQLREDGPSVAQVRVKRRYS